MLDEQIANALLAAVEESDKSDYPSHSYMALKVAVLALAAGLRNV